MHPTDDPVEGLLLAHLLKLAPRGWLAYLPRLVERYRTLAAEDRAALVRHGLHLRAHVQLAGAETVPQLLLELACLGAQWDGRRGDLWRRPSGREPTLTERELRDASHWLETAREALGLFRGLSAPQREAVRRLAAGAADEAGRERANETDDTLAVLLLLNAAHILTPDDPAARVAHAARYRALTDQQATRLAARALDILDSAIPNASDAAESVLVHLACLMPGGVQSVHLRLPGREIFYPGFLYHGADGGTRDVLIEALASDGVGSRHRGHLVDALAWIGDDRVRELFGAWQQAPPPWRGELHVPPVAYAPEGGWHLAPDGSRRDLCTDACRQLVPTGSAGAAGGPVRVIAPHEQRCGWCGRPLVTLLDLDLASPELAFLALAGERLRIASCERCSAYATVFTDVDLQGASRWSALNERPAFLGRDDDDWPGLPQETLTLGPERRTPIEGIVLLWESIGGVSQLGGHPTWEQDADYPDCPKCGLPMRFIGQVHLYEIVVSDGTIYAFVCAGCLIAATGYQQT